MTTKTESESKIQKEGLERKDKSSSKFTLNYKTQPKNITFKPVSHKKKECLNLVLIIGRVLGKVG